jgi:hypothetical protein
MHYLSVFVRKASILRSRGSNVIQTDIDPELSNARDYSASSIRSYKEVVSIRSFRMIRRRAC